MRRRWWLGGHEVEINPSQLGYDKKATAQPIVTANGVVSNPNRFYDRQLNFQLNILDQPTRIERPTMAKFPSGKYTAITEDAFFSQYYLLNTIGNSIDVYSRSGAVIKAFGIKQANVAFGKAVFTTTGNNGGSITDGNTDTYWDMLGNNGGDAVVDLGSLVTINSISFTTKMYTADIQVDISSDGTNYSTAFSLTSFSGGEKEQTISPSATRYIRLRVSNLTGNGGDSMFVSELSAKFIPVGNASGVAYMNGEVAWFYPNQGGGAAVVITDENGFENRKYYYANDANLKDVNHITYSSNDNSLYCMNKYGKIIAISLTDGSAIVKKQFTDYDTNANGSMAIYRSVHLYGDFIGVVKNSTVEYYTLSGYSIFHRIELPTNIVALTTDGMTRTFHMISNTKLQSLNMNLSIIELEQVKSVLGTGFFTLTDDSNIPKRVALTDMSVRRVREMSELRYEVSVNGIEQ